VSVLFGEQFALLERCGPTRCTKKEVDAFVLAVAATNERCSRLLFIPHAPKEGRKERRSFEGKPGGGQEGAEGRVWAGVGGAGGAAVAGTGGGADDDKDDCDEEEEDGVKDLTAVELAGALISMLTSGGAGSLLEYVRHAIDLAVDSDHDGNSDDGGGGGGSAAGTGGSTSSGGGGGKEDDDEWAEGEAEAGVSRSGRWQRWWRRRG
jgi:hypothetical protein